MPGQKEVQHFHIMHTMSTWTCPARPFLSAAATRDRAHLHWRNGPGHPVGWWHGDQVHHRVVWRVQVGLQGVFANHSCVLNCHVLSVQASCKQQAAALVVHQAQSRRQQLSYALCKDNVPAVCLQQYAGRTGAIMATQCRARHALPCCVPVMR
jgi:hypothetical protein